ncbi:hypothetical protein GE118_03650 [Mycoplasma sp. NEAQ87857]|uniref:hypothetical protein n=1 Tax=Mycoplasma sp. NEAQ87857 TaxID=2683967 RepID=UPI001319B5AC|nr:hypothetical protein [Mycoplasma sp. NEAQ87857]QGZ97877.1 hypothetical protein GE118_03650 [Mycoplasma sp. NEAQ87857]
MTNTNKKNKLIILGATTAGLVIGSCITTPSILIPLNKKIAIRDSEIARLQSELEQWKIKHKQLTTQKNILNDQYTRLVAINNLSDNFKNIDQNEIIKLLQEFLDKSKNSNTNTNDNNEIDINSLGFSEINNEIQRQIQDYKIKLQLVKDSFVKAQANTSSLTEAISNNISVIIDIINRSFEEVDSIEINNRKDVIKAIQKLNSIKDNLDNANNQLQLILYAEIQKTKEILANKLNEINQVSTNLESVIANQIATVEQQLIHLDEYSKKLNNLSTRDLSLLTNVQFVNSFKQIVEDKLSKVNIYAQRLQAMLAETKDQLAKAKETKDFTMVNGIDTALIAANVKNFFKEISSLDDQLFDETSSTLSATLLELEAAKAQVNELSEVKSSNESKIANLEELKTQLENQNTTLEAKNVDLQTTLTNLKANVKTNLNKSLGSIISALDGIKNTIDSDSNYANKDQVSKLIQNEKAALEAALNNDNNEDNLDNFSSDVEKSISKINDIIAEYKTTRLEPLEAKYNELLAQFNQLQEDLKTLQQNYDAKVLELNNIKLELESKKAELAQTQTQLLATTRELNTTKEQLETSNRLLANNKAKAIEILENLKAKEVELISKYSTYISSVKQAEETSLETYMSPLKPLMTNLEPLFNAITVLDDVQNQNLNTIQSKITEYNNKLYDLNNKMIEFQNEYFKLKEEALNDQIQDLEATKQKLNGNINDLNGQVINLKNEIKVKEAKIAEQGETITEQGETITEQGKTITKQGKTITKQGKTITKQGETIKTKDQEINALETEKTKLNKIIEDKIKDINDKKAQLASKKIEQDRLLKELLLWHNKGRDYDEIIDFINKLSLWILNPADGTSSVENIPFVKRIKELKEKYAITYFSETYSTKKEIFEKLLQELERTRLEYLEPLDAGSEERLNEVDETITKTNLKLQSLKNDFEAYCKKMGVSKEPIVKYEDLKEFLRTFITSTSPKDLISLFKKTKAAWIELANGMSEKLEEKQKEIDVLNEKVEKLQKDLILSKPTYLFDSIRTLNHSNYTLDKNKQYKWVVNKTYTSTSTSPNPNYRPRPTNSSFSPLNNHNTYLNSLESSTITTTRDYQFTGLSTTNQYGQETPDYRTERGINNIHLNYYERVADQNPNKIQFVRIHGGFGATNGNGLISDNIDIPLPTSSEPTSVSRMWEIQFDYQSKYKRNSVFSVTYSVDFSLKFGLNRQLLLDITINIKSLKKITSIYAGSTYEDNVINIKPDTWFPSTPAIFPNIKGSVWGYSFLDSSNQTIPWQN